MFFYFLLFLPPAPSKASGTILFEELVLRLFTWLNSVENLLSSEKGVGVGVGGGEKEEKKETHEFSSKPFSRFIFLLQFSWENPSMWLYIYFSVFTCQYFVFVAALNLLA